MKNTPVLLHRISGTLSEEPSAGQELLPTEDRYLSKRAVAEFLAVSVRTVERWNADSAPQRSFPLPRYFVGRPRWLQSEIQVWADQQTV